MSRGCGFVLEGLTNPVEDFQTDSVIQSSLRNELPKDITVITIAHRLQTIMDADKIVGHPVANIILPRLCSDPSY